MDCRCAELGEELNGAIQEAFDEASKVIASGGSYQSPLATVERGTVRGRMVGRDAEVELDLPTGPAADAVIEAHGNARATES